jgi:RNA polymerase sigma-70 factor (ECF subfamily)
VYAVLDRLPAQERVALILRRVEGLELREISERMGISLATVKRRLSVAETRMRRFGEGG